MIKKTQFVKILFENLVNLLQSIKIIFLTVSIGTINLIKFTVTITVVLANLNSNPAIFTDEFSSSLASLIISLSTSSESPKTISLTSETKAFTSAST